MAVKNPLMGIDISEWQGNVNFPKVKDSGVKFVILRATLGTSTDAMFRSYVAGAKAAGLPIHGVYHFCYALTADQAKKEAEYCVKEVEKAGLGKDVWIFYDFEYDTVNSAARHGVTLGPSECCQFTKIFCDTIKSYGYKTGVYTNFDYYRRMYSQEILSSYPIWIAYWSGDPGIGCVYHQYTSVGKVPGISGNVDMDYCFVDETDTPAPETQRKTVEELAKEVIEGKWGNGDERKRLLTEAGYDYDLVQDEVNRILTPGYKTVEEIAKEVIEGKWGNGNERKQRLIEAGYDYGLVQDEVNRLMGYTKAPDPVKTVSSTAYAQYFDRSYAGQYKVLADGGLYLRDGAGTDKPELVLIPNGTIVNCYGYFNLVGDVEWPYIQFVLDGVQYTGFSSGDYLKMI